VVETIESGAMTKDLAICVHGTTNVGGAGLLALMGAARLAGLLRGSSPPALPAGTARGAALPSAAAATTSTTPPPPTTTTTAQVTPDQYLNTEPFMDAIAKTFAKKLNAKL
jgi:hypothetical protein